MKLRPRALALKVRGDDLGALPGVTIPHPKYHRATREGERGWGAAASPAAAALGCDAAPPAARYFATFRGSCAHTGLGRGAKGWTPASAARSELARVFKGHRRGAAASATPRGAVVYECAEDDAKGAAASKTMSKTDEFDELMNTTCARDLALSSLSPILRFVADSPNRRYIYIYMYTYLALRYAMSPHGDGRWSIRLSQIIGARAVPLLVADALTLPCEHTALVGPRYVGDDADCPPLPFSPSKVRAARRLALRRALVDRGRRRGRARPARAAARAARGRLARRGAAPPERVPRARAAVQ